MSYAYKTPGVFREDVFVRPTVALRTGVPGFVGFGQARKAGVGPVALHRAEDLEMHFEAAPGSYLPDAVAGFFANGGVNCYVAGAAVNSNVKALTDALELLGPLVDLDLVAVPDAIALDEDATQQVQRAVIAHCSDHANRFAILDAPGGEKHSNELATDPVGTLKTWRDKLAGDALQAANAALYYPWVKVFSPDVFGGRPVPPCGHLAGIYARSDARVGVFKAPANEELLGVLDLEFPVDSCIQDGLNPEGINCLRALPGRGLRVWGARTLSVDENWRYINVRRLFLTVMRWIDRNLAWAAFEPNTPRLWNRIVRELNGYLGTLHEIGALKGTSAGQAFYVKCDTGTNPSEEREQGRVATEIGLAAALPGEFIVVRIIHREGAALLSP